MHSKDIPRTCSFTLKSFPAGNPFNITSRYTTKPSPITHGFQVFNENASIAREEHTIDIDFARDYTGRPTSTHTYLYISVCLRMCI